MGMGFDFGNEVVGPPAFSGEFYEEVGTVDEGFFMQSRRYEKQLPLFVGGKSGFDSIQLYWSELILQDFFGRASHVENVDTGLQMRNV